MENLSELQQAIISSLVYVEQFDYCLNKQEIFTRLPAKNIVTNDDFVKELLVLEEQKSILSKGDLYYLPGKSNLVSNRIEHNKISQDVLSSLQKRLWLFKLFPSIKSVLLTGSLAVLNSSKDDDIDMLIIVGNNTLWLTRFFLLIITDILKWRRQVKSDSFAQQWCLNILLETKYLEINPVQRNLYSAYEVIQTRQIYPQGDLWQQHFLKQNLWLKKYLPQIKILPNDLEFKEINQNWPLIFINTLFYYLQILYMKSKRTKEIITKHQVFFHPKPLGKIVINKFKDGLKRF